ncbi:hypothetical protein [Pontibacter beigongshangensis]|uniref:hypothetical protein n=1 Tax=Pontibacter beigongshangensis TaxID=2574733 RepID=UPI00164F81D4|nr:hypothetical protein [Pontibacter beigongshangensis]
MKAEVKDVITEGSSYCYLVSIKLSDYIKNLPDNYMNYEVQREIVNNTYLDNLIQTIIDNRHIPLMVLVAENSDLKPINKIIDLGAFKVLDGLQRTYRLKVIYDTIALAADELAVNPDITDVGRLQLSRQFNVKLALINSSVLILEKLLAYVKRQEVSVSESLNKLYDRRQWFELWVGLEPREEVNKMLILNAGHKAVKNQHQLELLFSNMLPLFKQLGFKGFTVIREKEVPSITYSKNRIPGQFHFSHLITAILSFNAGKPITNNVNLIQKTQAEDFDDSIFDHLINYNFFYQFIGTLMGLDKKLTARYDGAAVKWLGRETSLTGLFAACGKYAQEHEISSVESLQILEKKIGDHPDVLRLDTFEIVRNSMDLAKINIGSVNKRAVFLATNDILNDITTAADWLAYFKKEQW